jgi:flagellar biosynthesis/type III secretory pathway chaperone
MQTTVTTSDTNLLAALVGSKLRILELLVRLAHKQLSLADRGETTDLLKVLAAKQTVLAQLNQIERQLDPFRAQDPETRVWRTAADRQSCQRDAERCDELLAETMRVEKAGEAALIRRRDQVAGVLAEANAAGEAQAAYAGPVSPAAALHLRCEG